MFGDQDGVRRRLYWLIQRFRERGATSPEKAMTVQELGLPPRFEEAMHRRLGQSGIFVEVGGKYYLNEARLKQIQEERARTTSGGGGGGGWSGERPPSWSRYAGILLMLPIGVIIAVVLFYFFFFSWQNFPGEFLVILLIVLIAVFVARLLFWRSRSKYWRERSVQY